jgi:hypothetical protein
VARVCRTTVAILAGFDVIRTTAKVYIATVRRAGVSITALRIGGATFVGAVGQAAIELTHTANQFVTGIHGADLAIAAID